MAETLYIRLGSQSTQSISWLVYDAATREIIASGELPNAQALTQLTERAESRKVVAFVNASDIAFHALNVPAKNQRAMRQAAPYMIEDDIAQDVDEMFFAFGASDKQDEEHNCFVAGVERARLEEWLSWLSQANISTDTMIPDALALPQHGDKWSVMSLGEQVLVRQGHWQVMTLDKPLFDYMLNQWRQTPDIHLATYSPIETDADIDLLNIERQTEELPLALLAQSISGTTLNLLQGEYQVKLNKQTPHKPWLIAAGIAGVALVMHLAFTGISLYQLTQEQTATEQAIVDTYKKAFPQAKRVRVTTVRSEMKRKLAQIGESGGQAGFLALLNQVQPAFAKVPELKPESVKYDGKRNELRLTAVGSNYQAFDRFKTELEKLRLTVDIGSQNNQGEQVVGSMSIKG